MTAEGRRRIHFWYLVIFSIESSTTFLRIYCESGRVRAEAQTCGHCWKFGRGRTGPSEPRRDPRWNGTDQVGAGIVRSCRSPSGAVAVVRWRAAPPFKAWRTRVQN